MRLRWFVLGSVGLSISSLVVACSGSTSGGGTSAAPVPADQFVSRYVGAVCDNIGGCCQKSGFAYDAQGCTALGTQEIGAEFNPNQQGVVYDADAAGACIAALQKAASTCSSFDVESASACAGIFKGTLQEGAACTSSMQCATPVAGDAYCDVPLDGQSGTCVVHARGKAGDACNATCTDYPDGSGECSSSTSSTGTATCYTNDGLYCDQTCKPVIAVGQPCEIEGCAMGAYCNNGFCTAYPAAGEACAQGYLCAQGTFCQGSTCQAQLADGQACESGDQCKSGSCSGGVCGADTFVSQEVCSGVKP
jgi:hypothetical protein